MRVLLASLCVLLVMLSGTVELVHSHADRADVHSNCALCVTAHATVHLVHAPAPAVATAVFARVEAAQPAAVPRTFRAFSHVTRPPPAAARPA
ncbi:MAG TPA: hypothetical protein VG714_06545 [Acidobacteriaceae bacterium]|nr:hypothetical protein [Acidobacteriaceae bacterium]